MIDVRAFLIINVVCVSIRFRQFIFSHFSCEHAVSLCVFPRFFHCLLRGQPLFTALLSLHSLLPASFLSMGTLACECVDPVANVKIALIILPFSLGRCCGLGTVITAINPLRIWGSAHTMSILPLLSHPYDA